ncbi:hypothetical protein [Silvimonas soli]|uniref:hypothetical protein n=1 Tax=Silvimonas soli TaxID=2980100 RepID=UPI0024B37072|nr:hypothetical protein [Silvimonas soli]
MTFGRITKGLSLEITNDSILIGHLKINSAKFVSWRWACPLSEDQSVNVQKTRVLVGKKRSNPAFTYQNPGFCRISWTVCLPLLADNRVLQGKNRLFGGRDLCNRRGTQPSVSWVAQSEEVFIRRTVYFVVPRILI